VPSASQAIARGGSRWQAAESPFGDQSWEQEAEGVKALVCDVDDARWAIVE
jgi:hypothetical protein